MRRLLVLLILFPASAFAQTPAPTTAPVKIDRVKEFLDDSIRSPLFYVLVVGQGLIDQVGDYPKEWSGDGGYAKRNVARLEELFAAEAIGHGVASALNHDVQYDVCGCHGALPRVGHAIGRVFVSRRLNGGGLAPNISRMTALYGAAAIADFWYPPSYTKSDIFLGATLSLATSAGLNIIREFIVH